MQAQADRLTNQPANMQPPSVGIEHRDREMIAPEEPRTWRDVLAEQVRGSLAVERFRAPHAQPGLRGQQSFLLRMSGGCRHIRRGHRQDISDDHSPVPHNQLKHESIITIGIVDKTEGSTTDTPAARLLASGRQVTQLGRIRFAFAAQNSALGRAATCWPRHAACSTAAVQWPLFNGVQFDGTQFDGTQFGASVRPVGPTSRRGSARLTDFGHWCVKSAQHVGSARSAAPDPT